ncbi:hypothetical protein [uncultured Prevotella sp.]|uniref:hypothetical protein n=1 Tax=uncultured Prevotella sp. TaxID=159272 RepID=UPI00258F1B82|nr:hypothetical protein [uncultured Prevotella sp.]
MTEETKIPLPGEDDALNVPEFLKSKGWFDENIDDDFLNFEDPYKPPRYTLCRYGIPFANVGELHVISGKPGHGKTGLMSQLMAAILCGRFGNTLYHIQSERPKPVVLYIDTEQGKDDTIAIKNRVCLLAGLDYTQKQPQFQILRLRDTEDASERWKKILKAVWLVKPTDIFLDGMLDIVRDYNDQVECQPIIREAMMLATHYDSSLWIVLHENPMVDKLVGTLGSIVQRKVAEIFSVKKIKQSELKPNEKQPNRPSIYFTVKQLKARGRDVADWDYAYQQNAAGWGMPVELDDNGATVVTVNSKELEMMKEADERFKSFNWQSSGATYSELERHLKSVGVTSNRRVSALFEIAMEKGIIYKNGKKYHYNGLRDLANDAPEDLPFEGGQGDAPF